MTSGLYVCQEGDLIPQGDCIVLYCIDYIPLGTVPWPQPRLVCEMFEMFVLILGVVWFSPSCLWQSCGSQTACSL